MKPLKRLGLILTYLLFSLYSFTQSELGEATLSYVKAKPLLRSESLFSALKSVTYLSRVGGVAFDKMAAPEEGLEVNDLKLSYNSAAPDGQRFSLLINGNIVNAAIYDWELVPIAKYANSRFNACFTLFGDLENQEKANSIEKRQGRILNYHPDLVNTLLGLRLFQLDILIVEPRISVYLPKKDDKYLLGAGETSPNIGVNRIGYQVYSLAFNQKKQEFSSYVICDQNVSIKFGIQNNSLTISGEPFYYFFRFNTDEPSFKKAIEKNITDKIVQVREQGRTESEKNSLLETWLLLTIQKEFDLLQKTSPQSNFEKYIREVRSLKATIGMKAYLDELILILYDLKISNSKKVIYLNNLSNSLSGQPQLFSGINPAVWHAGVTTMRYAAFFRYCKAKFPAQWKIFMAQVNRIQITPYARTPTVLEFPNYRTDN